MKRILVPCDFSTISQEAVKFAVNLASRTGGEVIVLHVIYIPILHDPIYEQSALAFDPGLMQELEEDSKKRYNKMIGGIQGSAKVTLEIIKGEIISSIKWAIETKEIDLVIMGTSGVSGWREIMIGSNTEKVVRNSPAPVLVVRVAPEINSIKKILLPTTLSLDQTEFISKVKELQDFFTASLHVLLINTPRHFRHDPESHEALEEFAKHYKLKDYVLHFKNYYDEEEGIIDFADTEKVDMIVMATHGRKGLAHVFNGSIAEDVVNHIKCPVWTYRLNK